MKRTRVMIGNKGTEDRARCVPLIETKRQGKMGMRGAERSFKNKKGCQSDSIAEQKQLLIIRLRDVTCERVGHALFLIANL